MYLDSVVVWWHSAAPPIMHQEWAGQKLRSSPLTAVVCTDEEQVRSQNGVQTTTEIPPDCSQPWPRNNRQVVPCYEAKPGRHDVPEVRGQQIRSVCVQPRQSYELCHNCAGQAHTLPRLVHSHHLVGNVFLFPIFPPLGECTSYSPTKFRFPKSVFQAFF